MTEPSEFVLEHLREGTDFTVYRGRKRGNATPVLAVAPASERPSPQSLRRLEHEYSLEPSSMRRGQLSRWRSLVTKGRRFSY